MLFCLSLKIPEHQGLGFRGLGFRGLGVPGLAFRGLGLRKTVGFGVFRFWLFGSLNAGILHYLYTLNVPLRVLKTTNLSTLGYLDAYALF